MLEHVLEILKPHIRSLKLHSGIIYLRSKSWLNFPKDIHGWQSWEVVLCKTFLVYYFWVKLRVLSPILGKRKVPLPPEKPDYFNLYKCKIMPPKGAPLIQNRISMQNLLSCEKQSKETIVYVLHHYFPGIMERSQAFEWDKSGFESCLWISTGFLVSHLQNGLNNVATEHSCED